MLQTSENTVENSKSSHLWAWEIKLQTERYLTSGSKWGKKKKQDCFKNTKPLSEATEHKYHPFNYHSLLHRQSGEKINSTNTPLRPVNVRTIFLSAQTGGISLLFPPCPRPWCCFTKHIMVSKKEKKGMNNSSWNVSHACFLRQEVAVKAYGRWWPFLVAKVKVQDTVP